MPPGCEWRRPSRWPRAWRGWLRLQLEALPYRDLEGGTSIPAVLHVDTGMLPAPEQGQPLAVEVYGYALSAGRVVDSLSLTVSVDVPQHEAALRSHGLRVVTAFTVPTGRLDLRFFVCAGAPGRQVRSAGRWRYRRSARID